MIVKKEKIVQERESLELSQTQFCKEVWISRPTLFQIEQKWVWSEQVIYKILRFLNKPKKKGQFITKRIKKLNLQDIIILWK